MTIPLKACRRCAQPLDVGSHPAVGSAPSRALLIDIACTACGHRALYGWSRDAPAAASVRLAPQP